MGHAHDPDPTPSGEPVLIAGRDARSVAIAASLAVAVLMLVGKLVAYTLTGSSAIFSDALESVVHLAATVVAAASLWYARQPPDQRHLYGHGKIAYFSSGMEGALILIAAAGILYEAVQALLQGPELERLGLGLLITGALALVNLALGLTLVRVGKRTNALVLVANGHHVLTDMWTSLGVLVGVGLVALTDLVWLDPVIAIAVGLNILWTAFGLMRAAYRGLMEEADPEETARVTRVLDDAVAAGTVTGFHHVRHRRVNDQVWIEAHLLFPDRLTLPEAHARATAVESELRTLFPRDSVLVTTHLEPEAHHHPEAAGHDAVADALAPE